MRCSTIIFPCDYFASDKVEESFRREYDAALASGRFDVVLFNYDAFIEGGPIRFSHPVANPFQPLIYRGWMMKPEQYERFCDGLVAMSLRPITPAALYGELHMFAENYPGPDLSDEEADTSEYPPTPARLAFEGTKVDAEAVNAAFDRFMVKDYVKSVKGTSFPTCINTPVTQEELDGYIVDFVEKRGDLFTGGIVLKQFVDLKRYGATTNEWRAFYFAGSLLTLQRNSNQDAGCPRPPESFVTSCAAMNSPYFTIDFAELEDGEWVVIEGGDGQVSGLATSQDPVLYYQVLGDAAERLFTGYSNGRFDRACEIALANTDPGYYLSDAKDVGQLWMFTWSRCDGALEIGGPRDTVIIIGKEDLKVSHTMFAEVLEEWYTAPDIPIPAKYVADHANSTGDN